MDHQNLTHVMSLEGRIAEATRPVIFYEIIPPPVTTRPAEMEATTRAIADLLGQVQVRVDALNIPEVRPESREQPRPQNFVPKMAPREFARIMRAALPEGIDLIINRCVVYAPRASQLRWLLRTYCDFGLRHVVLVGGESSRVRYPGPSVTEAARLIVERLNHGIWPYNGRVHLQPTRFHLGGITIPSRRRSDPLADEPRRLVEKARCGIAFFTSQILYEPEAMKRLLDDYEALCQSLDQAPRRIFLSFAPASSPGDVQFLKWLGVDIPPAVERELLTGWLGVAMRSLRIAERVLEEILDFVATRRLNIPLGLNIEHITSRNFEISGEMMDRLGRIYLQHVAPRNEASEAWAETAVQWSGVEPEDP